jgi:flagellar motor protein MotB
MKRNIIKVFIAAAAVTALLPSRLLYSAISASSSMAAGISLRVMEKLIPEPTEPPVRFRIQFDSVQDPFGPEKPAEDSGISAWQIQVFDRTGRKVSYLQGAGSPADASIPWSGTAPDGQPLPDGFYDVRFAWVDGQGRPHASGRESLSLATPLEIRALAGRKLAFSYTFEGLVITINEKLIFRPGESAIQPGALPALRDIRAFLAANPENKVTVRPGRHTPGAPLIFRSGPGPAPGFQRYRRRAGAEPQGGRSHAEKRRRPGKLAPGRAF